MGVGAQGVSLVEIPWLVVDGGVGILPCPCSCIAVSEQLQDKADSPTRVGCRPHSGPEQYPLNTKERLLPGTQVPQESDDTKL